MELPVRKLEVFELLMNNGVFRSWGYGVRGSSEARQIFLSH